MADGLEIVLADPKVKSELVNVFEGITACDTVANGIVQAIEMLKARGELIDKPGRSGNANGSASATPPWITASVIVRTPRRCSGSVTGSARAR